MKRRLAFAILLVLATALAVWILRARWTSGEPPLLPTNSSAFVEEPAGLLVTPNSERDLAAVPETTSAGRVAVPETPRPASVRSLEVRVLDYDRNPIAGARVEWLNGTPPTSFVTDGDGRTSIPVTAVGGESLDLQVCADGFASVRGTWLDPDEVLVLLARAVELRGRVLDKATLRPIPHASVEYSRWTNCKPCDPVRTTSDAEGRYALAQVATRSSERFRVGSADFPLQTFFVTSAEDSAVAEHDFLLDAGVAFSGVIVDFETDAPVAGAVVENEGDVYARTDAGGRFEARVAPVASTGRIGLVFGAAGRCRLRRTFTREDLGAASPLRVPLPRSAAVEGRVRDENGRPVADLEIVVLADSAQVALAKARGESNPLLDLLRTWRVEPETHSISAVTDGSGTFRHGGLVPYVPLVKLQSQPSAAGRVEAQVAPLGGPGSTAQVEAVLRRDATATIAGRVLLNGAPVSAVVAWRGSSRAGSIECDRYGRFALESVETGRVLLSIDRAKYSVDRFLNREESIALTSGERVERDFDLLLPMAPIAGRVVRDDGRSAEGLGVQLVESVSGLGAHRATARTGAEGRFALEVPAESGPYQVITYIDERPFEQAGVRPGDEDVVIHVFEVPTFLCRAVDDVTHEPIPRIDVYARATGGDAYALASNPIGPVTDGWTPVRLGAGTYDLTATAQERGYLPVVRDGVVVPPHGTTRLEIEMTRGATVELRLVEGLRPWAQDRFVALLEADLVATLEGLPELPSRLEKLNARAPGVDPRIGRTVDLARQDVAVVRGLASGRYRLFDSTRGLVLTPDVIEIRALDTTAVRVGWRLR